MKRSRDRTKQGLRHLAFFARRAEAPDGSLEAAVADAGLFGLRLLDHYILAGDISVATDGIGVQNARRTILTLPEGDALRTALHDYVDRLTRIPRDGIALVYPDMFPVAEAYEQKGLFTLAADVFMTIADYADDKTLAANALRMAKAIEGRLGRRSVD